MEFPALGEHCQFENCNQVDFLPLQCRCEKIFCREHFLQHCISGGCEMAPKPKEVNFKKDDNIFRCSEKGCRKGSFLEMKCLKCGRHFCVEHRFHPSCPEIDEDTLAAKIELFEAPRRQFKEANKHLQEKITQNIRKALQSSSKYKTAAKVHLMRIKQKAVGPKSIPTQDRVYVSIQKPKSLEPKPVKIIQDEQNWNRIDVTLDPDVKDTVATFISAKWSLGRAIDSICESCGIQNDNNKRGDTKLRLFRQLDGYCISPVNMEVEISELLKQEILIEGDKLLVEYIRSDTLTGLEDNAQIFLS